MTNSISNGIKNLIAQELERRGLTSSSKPTNQDSMVAYTEYAQDVPSAPVGTDYAGAELPNPNVPEEVVQHPEYQVSPVIPAPIGTPDSSQFSVTQTLIPPSNSSDVANVSILIQFPDVSGATDYKVRWVTA